LLFISKGGWVGVGGQWGFGGFFGFIELISVSAKRDFQKP
jgi:hypothetical protein